MNRIVICTFLFAFFSLIGCSKTIDQSMVFGKYIANHKKGIDSLELRSDGIYVHHYKKPDGEDLRNSNTWKFEYLDGKPTITFSAFIFGLPGYGSQEPGFWIVEIQRSLGGNLRLCIDPDLNYYYIKQES